MLLHHRHDIFCVARCGCMIFNNVKLNMRDIPSFMIICATRWNAVSMQVVLHHFAIYVLFLNKQPFRLLCLFLTLACREICQVCHLADVSSLFLPPFLKWCQYNPTRIWSLFRIVIVSWSRIVPSVIIKARALGLGRGSLGNEKLKSATTFWTPLSLGMDRLRHVSG